MVKKWDDAVRDALKDPAFVAEMESLGAPPAYLGPKDFKAALEAEYKTAMKFAEKLGLRK